MKRLLLIGCGKTKASTPQPARDLYTGPLFRARRAFAERSGHPWLIVSGLHGTLAPDELVAPYDQTVPTERNLRTQWALLTGLTLGQRLTRIFPEPPKQLIVELHAGRAYYEPLHWLWVRTAYHLEWPVQGLGIGKQLNFYQPQCLFELSATAVV